MVLDVGQGCFPSIWAETSHPEMFAQLSFRKPQVVQNITIEHPLKPRDVNKEWVSTRSECLQLHSIISLLLVFVRTHWGRTPHLWARTGHPAVSQQHRELEMGAGMAKKAQMGLGVGEAVAVDWLESVLGSRQVEGQDHTKCPGAFS